MARWREERLEAQLGAVGVLLRAERRAVADGDAERLAQVRSWLDMLHHAGDHPGIADLFATMAGEECP